jgi:hypothetical protein
MDTIPSDESVQVGADPLDVVEHVLSAENLPFDRTEDGDLAFTLGGDWKDYELWFAWRPEGDCLQLCLSMDLTVAKAQRGDAHELISQVNPRVWLGHFELWEDGEIIFRHGMTLMSNEQPSLAQAAGMIDVAVEAADRFFPAFDFLVKGAKSPAEAIAACMFETMGEA